MSEMTVSDGVRLKQLETTITKGSKAFIEVGLALAEIRDSKLYRVHFSTFDAYCQEKWGFKKRRAYDLIESAETAGALSDEKCSMLHNQRQASALSCVPEPDREKVLEAAKAKADEEERPMTAADIKAQWDAATVDVDPAQSMRPDEDERWRALQRGEAVLANDHRDRALIQRAESRGLAVRIDRKGPGWGNPWIEGLDGTRDKVCDNYHDLYWPTKPSLHKRLHEVSGKLLICWCYPERCHGLTIIEALNQAEGQI